MEQERAVQPQVQQLEQPYSNHQIETRHHCLLLEHSEEIVEAVVEELRVPVLSNRHQSPTSLRLAQVGVQAVEQLEVLLRS